MTVVRKGMPTGPDLALLRELHAKGVHYVLGGCVGAAVQGVPSRWWVLDVYVSSGHRAELYTAQLVTGHEPQRWPEPPGREVYAPVTVHEIGSAPGWQGEWDRSVEVTIEGIPVRARPIARIVREYREIDWYDFDAVRAMEEFLEARGEGEPQRPYVPETRLGMLYGSSLSAVESILCGAGYTRSSSGRARTYSVAYDDVEPRTGARSADIAYAEDPERPVSAAIQQALGRR